MATPTGPVDKLAAAVQHIADDGLTTHIEPAETRPPPDRGPMPLWISIRNRRMDYQGYARFIDQAFCVNPIAVSPPPIANQLAGTMKEIREDGERTGEARRCLQIGWLGHGLNAYELLKTATEIFLLLECGIQISGYRDLPNGGIVIPGAERSRIDGTPTLNELQNFLAGYLGGFPVDTRVTSGTCVTPMPDEIISCRRQKATPAHYCRSSQSCPEIPELWTSSSVVGVQLDDGCEYERVTTAGVKNRYSVRRITTAKAELEMSRAAPERVNRAGRSSCACRWSGVSQRVPDHASVARMRAL